ncbi:helix-turn-helix domain-containing protein [Rossellomorea aquimaris]|uniref:helix-turn-helix domain-containing protein n=1 Tax=Rossellomorea aquimaris TaxID=189382 RepID=UPI001CD70576|nr:helix-turn-helix transcriptional regulator [Rossellomorea aquimaris]MCA1054309.1 helix-turn-helix domain-containing protein [Rossellomorea aquimaris]
MDIQQQLNQIIGKRIRKELKLKKLTIESMAELAKIHDTHLGDIERGNVNTSLHTLFRIAAGLGLETPYTLLHDAKQDIYPLMQEEVKVLK